MDGTRSLRLALAAALLLAALPAVAADFVVDSTDDAADAAIDGTCADADGQCTLRAALQEANATPLDADTIQIPAGSYVLKRTGALEDAGATGDLDVTGPVVITGAGAAETVLRGKKDRLFDIYADGATLNDLTLTKGKAPKSDEDDEASGGAIRNFGSLALNRVVITHNQAADDSGGITNVAGTLALTDVELSRNKAADDAGALDNDGGTVTLLNVTFYKNKAKDEAGAFESELAGTVDGENVTISGNKAREAGGANAEQGGTIALVNATVIGNKSREGGGGLQNEDVDSSFSVTNSLVAANKKASCSGPITSLGGNLDAGTSCGFAQPTDQSGFGDVGLAKKIADNGGPTPTHALLPGSPAIDAADDAECPASDQRGQARVDDPSVAGSNVCDRGAFELAPPG